MAGRLLALVVVLIGCRGETVEVGAADAHVSGSDSAVVDVGAEAATDTATVCGDGKRAGAEACDDGNTAAGDGCSKSCEIESGFKCAGETSICVPIEPRSCAGGLVCGALSCCDAKPVTGGTFPLGRAVSGPESDPCTTWASGRCLNDEQPAHDATVASFALDTNEVSVSRFRKFVDAYPSSKPVNGAGAHPQISGAVGTRLHGTRTCRPTALRFSNRSSAARRPRSRRGPTWRLATNASRSTASTGTSPLRSARGTAVDCRPRRNGNTPRREAARTAPFRGATRRRRPLRRSSASGNRVIRGGDFNDVAGALRVAHRSANTPTFRGATVGVRCARDP